MIAHQIIDGERYRVVNVLRALVVGCIFRTIRQPSLGIVVVVVKKSVDIFVGCFPLQSPGDLSGDDEERPTATILFPVVKLFWSVSAECLDLREILPGPEPRQSHYSYIQDAYKPVSRRQR